MFREKNKHIFFPPEMPSWIPQHTLILSFSKFQISCCLCYSFGLRLWAVMCGYSWFLWSNRNSVLRGSSCVLGSHSSVPKMVPLVFESP